MEKLYQVSYNSDTIITDAEELSTLCIFYDKIILPYADPEGNFLKIEKDEKGQYKIGEASMFIKYNDAQGIERKSGTDLSEWEKANKVLFSEAVLERLSTKPGVNLYLDQFITDLSSMLLKSPTVLGFNDPNAFMVRESVVEHLYRTDVNIPGVFTVRKNVSKTEVLKSLEALHVFKYLLPGLSSLHPDEILRIREKVKDTREGFSMHLQKLSADVHAALAADAKFDDISYAASHVIESSLIPDYTEFRRQLASERTGFAGKVLAVTGKILEIDAAPWTPKFWGQTFKAFGEALGVFGKKEKSMRTNEQVAFRFMHLCESVNDKS